MKTKLPQTGADIFRHLLLAWLMAVTVGYLALPSEQRNLASPEGLQNMSFWFTVLFTAGGGGLLWFLSCRISLKNAEKWCMTGLFCVLAFASVSAAFSWPYFTVCVLMAAGLILYGIYGWNQSETVQQKKIYLLMTAFFSVVFLLFLSVWTVSKVKSFGTSTYDFGLFSQMFYYMEKTGLPLTTLERDGLLSHFAIHVSPIYYLMLPFYLIAPRPATLQVLQAAVMTSAVIPLWKICTLHKLPDWQKMLLCVLLMLFPAFAGGVSYDLHENCFLTPLLLWLLYGLDKKSIPVTVVAAVLTLAVKEDAAVYVAVVALWEIVRTLLRHQGWKTREFFVGLGLLSGALLWFGIATWILSRFGKGVMTYRYDNFMFDGSASLFTVIRAVIMNPMKAVYECVDPEKIKFIGLTLLPLAGLPLLTRRYERYLLLIPYLLVNLMSDYPYQHNIRFQYSFGSAACLVYLAVVNLADMKVQWKRVSLLAVGVIVSIYCFMTEVFPSAKLYTSREQDYRERWEQTAELLDRIPKEASVAATCYHTTYLSQREILYDIEYASKAHILESEYVVLSGQQEYKTFSPEGIEGKEQLLAMLEENGYEPWEHREGIGTIYRRPSPANPAE